MSTFEEIITQARLTLGQDLFERSNWPFDGFTNGSIAYYDAFKHEMWRVVIANQIVAKYIPILVRPKSCKRLGFREVKA